MWWSTNAKTPVPGMRARTNVELLPPPVNIPPMPGVREAIPQLLEAGKAIGRGIDAWNPAQVEDAIRSARFFMERAERALEVGRPKTEPKE